MPPLSPINILGELVFVGKMHKLPTEWKQPQGDPAAKHYDDSLKPEEKVATPGQTPFPWLNPQNANKYHQDSCDEIGKAYKELYDGLIDAVKFGVDMWRLEAKLKDLKVMAVSAIGTPGCLDGPKMEDKIKMFPGGAAWKDNKKKFLEACAKGVGECFDAWAAKVMVPGLPWYPAFAAFPGPMAPPMPNVPVPFIACPSAMMSKIVAPSDMKKACVDALDQKIKDDDPDKFHETLFEAVATTLSLAFLMWLPQQQVMLVMGKGPIPTFSPPYVPVGPVVSGDNIGAPGHTIA
ncbi:MAG: hypothetical protein JW797_11145 [Bradymonadales bacterium]|nr:hypothetical protein [Bradymonadales bacterium]